MPKIYLINIHKTTEHNEYICNEISIWHWAHFLYFGISMYPASLLLCYHFIYGGILFFGGFVKNCGLLWYFFLYVSSVSIMTIRLHLYIFLVYEMNTNNNDNSVWSFRRIIELNIWKTRAHISSFYKGVRESSDRMNDRKKAANTQILLTSYIAHSTYTLVWCYSSFTLFVFFSLYLCYFS